MSTLTRLLHVLVISFNGVRNVGFGLARGFLVKLEAFEGTGEAQRYEEGMKTRSVPLARSCWGKLKRIEQQSRG